MYPWIWRHLPGNLAVKLVTTLLVIAGMCALLLFVVFPAVEPHLPINDVTVPGS